ncbi:Carbonic anhydrase [Mactra antiquata]
MNVILGIILFVACLHFSEASSSWGYVNEKGPDHWADLFPDACAGRKQSPIDIRTQYTVFDPSLKDFAIFFDPPAPGSRFYVHNNGHTIQVNTEGKFFVSNGGLQDIYSTAQFHFHWGHRSHHGSEHTMDGVASPIEMHIVSWNSGKYASIGEAVTEPSGLAVLGILFEITKEDNPILEPLVNVLKHVRDPDQKIKAEIPAVSMRAFLPAAPDRYYRYNGSLTTPGCFESVVWTVFHYKQTISRRQLHVFRQVLKPLHHRKKRSTNHQYKVVQAVFDEIGIEDNEAELARFRRQLEEKVDNVEVVVDETAQAETTKRHGQTDHSQANGNPKPAAMSAQPVSNSQTSHAEQVRKMLVNNYRPVQPLNGRVVYRSFPFFDEPIKDTEVVYIERDVYETPSGGASTVYSLTTLCTIICSYVLIKFL